MRSNIARTCVSGSVPAAWPAIGVASGPSVAALERGDVADQLVELLRLLLLELREVGHERGRIQERSRDRLAAEPVADLGEVGAERVAVLADLVAAEAAGGRHHLLALLELRFGLERDLARRPGERSEHGQVGHRR